MKKTLITITLAILCGTAYADIEETFYSNEDMKITYGGPFDGKGLYWFLQDFCEQKGYSMAIDSKSSFQGFELVYDYISCSRPSQSETFTNDEGKAIIYFGPSDGKGLNQFETSFCQSKGYALSSERDYTRYTNAVVYHSITCSE